MINRALQKQPIIVYGDGEQQRCFSYIDDCISCLVKMGFQEGLNGEIINIGPDEQPITINALANDLAVICNTRDGSPQVEIRHMPGRPQEVKVALCSSDKARRLLGYKTETKLHAGLCKMMVYIVNRGPKPFEYHLPLEIVTDKTPKTWTEQLF